MFAKLLLAVAVVVGGVTVAHMASAGIQNGPACITQTMHPGSGYSTTVNVVNPGKDPVRMGMSVQNVGGPAAAVGRPVPPSWVSFSGAGDMAPKSTAAITVTVNVPNGAKAGRYGGQVVATAYGGQPSGSGTHVGLGAAAATYLEFSVNAPPPPKAFCDGQRQTYFAWHPRLPACKHGQPPLQGRQTVCRVLPLPPPAFSARACGWSTAQMHAYLTQLRAAGRRYAHNPGAYLADAHCIVRGHILNRPKFYRGTGWYRSAHPHDTSPATTARTW